MKVLTKSKNLVRASIIGGSAAILLAAPSAMAHGFNGNYSAGYQQGAHQGSVQTAAYTQYGNHNVNVSSNSNFKWESCTQKQQALDQIASKIKSQDQKRLNGLNIILSGVQNYVTGGVTVNNYAALNARSVSAQTTATNDVNAITAPQLNCSGTSTLTTTTDNTSTSGSSTSGSSTSGSSTTGSSTTTTSSNGSAIASFNTSVQTANQALATYRHDVTDLFQAAINS
jgi:hypothetical protein